MYKESYLPVGCDFYDELTALSFKKENLKIFFFNEKNEVDEAKGLLTDILTLQKEEFAQVGDQKVRLDKMITINGRPGPAYEEYDSYANACLSCQLGYE
ncbi:hypothetical protein [Sediminitomix flava]|uniref:Rho-binding antiterminator n=1 Tax=Sediminitomix flava TaxID=379075 RepID=A0A315ZYX0_SEDFL|nr:hypothetical protein [Sediminitomix flava]PWJ42567.1 hypothetical protein BC781_102110 [Sediminitomix flava]